MRIAVASLFLAMLWSGPVFVPDALAQDRAERPWSLRSLFFPGQRVRGESIERREAPQVKKKPVARKKPKKPVKRNVEPEIALVPKAPDARTILVVGDFVAAAAAEGLNAVFASTQTVKILDRSNSSSGLVREDHYDWPGKIAELIQAEKPAVVVMLVGANDRQQMRIGGARETLRSEAWTQEYSARAMSFASAVVQEGTPLVWIGAPAFKSAKSISDMLALNEIYRKVAVDAGVEFIDVWDGFVDERGSFIITGPDVSGQSVRLRTGDGINLTAAGKRKLAFYAEKHLRKLLGINEPGDRPTLTSPESASAAQKPFGPANIPAVDRTVPISLNDPALDGGKELLGGGYAADAPMPIGSRRAPAMAAGPSVPGRADNFAVQPDQPASTAAIPPADAATAAERASPMAPSSAAN